MQPGDLCASADLRLARYRLLRGVLKEMVRGTPFHEASSRHLEREADHLYRAMMRDPARDVPVLAWKLRELAEQMSLFGRIFEESAVNSAAGVIMEDLKRFRRGALPD